MTPTVFREGTYRFHFFSREEKRPHVHVVSSGGEAKFWIDPEIELARTHGFGAVELREIRNILERRLKEVRDAWNRHFAG